MTSTSTRAPIFIASACAMKMSVLKGNVLAPYQTRNLSVGYIVSTIPLQVSRSDFHIRHLVNTWQQELNLMIACIHIFFFDTFTITITRWEWQINLLSSAKYLQISKIMMRLLAHSDLDK
ncbi:uncharacterized protein LOC141652075 [Silene latifolia]|uniref:uncharacterized protein LOC141652075 n=1 Tax=Silene latifolia TaxID=37657 RepID=UPI003D77088E